MNFFSHFWAHLSIAAGTPHYKLPSAFKSLSALQQQNLCLCLSLQCSVRLQWQGLGSLKHLQEVSYWAWLANVGLPSWDDSACYSHAFSNPLPACCHGGEKSKRESESTKVISQSFAWSKKFTHQAQNQCRREISNGMDTWKQEKMGLFMQWIYHNIYISVCISICINIYLFIYMYYICTLIWNQSNIMAKAGVFLVSIMTFLHFMHALILWQ